MVFLLYNCDVGTLRKIFEEEENFNKHSPPIRRIDDRDLAYFPVTYKHGTVCDLTGKPRTTVVMYVCKEVMKFLLLKICFSGHVYRNI